MKRALAAFFILSMIMVTACNPGNLNITEPEKEEYRPEQGGSVRVPVLDFDTYNPIVTASDSVRDVLSLIYEPLFIMGLDNKPKNILADRYSLSDGGTRYTITLKNNIKWHDGSPLSVSDVLYTMSCILQDSNFSCYKGQLIDVASYVKTSDNTFDITLKNPDGGFVSRLNFPIIKNQGTADLVTNKQTFSPIGTGAYMLEKRDKNNLVLKQNKSWLSDGKAYINEVYIQSMPDIETAMRCMTAGEIDLLPPQALMGAAKYSINQNEKIKTITSNNYLFLGMNNNLEKLKNSRRAISAIIDRGAISKNVLGGRALVTDMPFGAISYQESLYEPSLADFQRILDEDSWMYFDSEKKYKKVIGGSTVELSIAILINDDSSDKKNIAETIKQQLKVHNVSVEIISVPFEEYTKRIMEGSYETYIGEINMFNKWDVGVFFRQNNMLSFSPHDISGMYELMREDIYKNGQPEVLAGIYGYFSRTKPVIGLGFRQKEVIYNKKIKWQNGTGGNSIYEYFYECYVSRK